MLIFQNRFLYIFLGSLYWKKVNMLDFILHRFAKVYLMFTCLLCDSKVRKYSLQKSGRKTGLARGCSTQIPTFFRGQSKQGNIVPAAKLLGVKLNNYLGFYTGFKIFQNKMYVVLFSNKINVSHINFNKNFVTLGK